MFCKTFWKEENLGKRFDYKNKSVNFLSNKLRIMSDLSSEMFVKVNFGDEVPTGALLAGETAEDGILYIGRNEFDEIGKYNTSVLEGNRANTACSLWCDDTGRTIYGNEILVIPTGMTYEWVAYRKGDPLPPNALHAGWYGEDGALFIGRAMNSVGKINTSSGSSNGKINNLLIQGIGCLTEGEILTVTPGNQSNRWDTRVGTNMFSLPNIVDKVKTYFGERQQEDADEDMQDDYIVCKDMHGLASQ